MPRGTVKWFNEEKGYGFITPSDGSEDLFVQHARKVGRGCESLEEGAGVSYEVAQGRKVCRRQTFLRALPTDRTAGAQGTPCAYRWGWKVPPASSLSTSNPTIFTGRWQRRYAESDDGGTMPSRA